MSQSHHSYCRNCSGLCGLVVEVDNNKVLEIRGDREHPLTKGYFCIKGLSSKDLHNGEDRYVVPVKRLPDGRRVEIDPETALDEIHAKLAEIIERHGPESVGFYYGTGLNTSPLGYAAMKGGMKLLGTPYVFSSMTIDQSSKWVAAARMGMWTAGIRTLRDADVAMYVGINPAISHMGFPVAPRNNPRLRLKQEKARGMKLIVIDPRLTETAKLADIHLQIKPGEDQVLLAGMIHLVFANGWQDGAFCDRFAVNVDRLRSAVSDFTPDYVAARAGISKRDLLAATEMFACAARPTSVSGTGPSMGPYSNLNEHLLQALNVLCGAFLRAGEVIRNTGVLFGDDAVPREHVIPPYRAWENGPKLKATDIGPLFGEYPTACLPSELVGTDRERLRALFVFGGNPAKAIVDPDVTHSAFKNLDLLVTLDPRMTVTAQTSHYAIPTSLNFERLDFTGMFDRLFETGFAQMAEPIIERPSGVMHDWEFLWGLARRMGRPLPFKRPMFGLTHDQTPAEEILIDTSGEKPSTEDILRLLMAQGRIDFDRLRHAPHGLEISSEAVILPPENDDGARLDLLPLDVAEELARAAIDSLEDEYRYRLTGRRMLETMNSAYRYSSKVLQRYATNPAYMSPQDMAAEGLTRGDAIDIISDHGRIVGYVEADAGMRRGAIGMAHLWGACDEESDPHGLTGGYTGRLVSLKQDCQTINYMPRQSAIPVNIQRHDVRKTERASVSSYPDRDEVV